MNDFYNIEQLLNSGKSIRIKPQGYSMYPLFRQGLDEAVIEKADFSTLHRGDVVVLDMDAGLEHMGRGTTEGMDQFIVVIEPGSRSVQTYKNVKRLAKDLGVKQVHVVANKIRDEKDEEFVKEHIPAEDLLGFIHYNTEIMDADRQGCSPYDYSKSAVDEIRKIKTTIDKIDDCNK